MLLSLRAIPVGHSLLFAIGAWPPQDGVRRARSPDLSRDLRGIAALRLRTLRRNGAASASVRRKLELLWSCDQRRRRRLLLTPLELAAVGPHAVQDHRKRPILAAYRLSSKPADLG